MTIENNDEHSLQSKSKEQWEKVINTVLSMMPEFRRQIAIVAKQGFKEAMATNEDNRFPILEAFEASVDDAMNKEIVPYLAQHAETSLMSNFGIRTIMHDVRSEAINIGMAIRFVGNPKGDIISGITYNDSGNVNVEALVDQELLDNPVLSKERLLELHDELYKTATMNEAKLKRNLEQAHGVGRGRGKNQNTGEPQYAIEGFNNKEEVKAIPFFKLAKEIMVALTQNAYEMGRQHGETMTINIKAKVGDKDFTFSVIDDGPGVPPEKAETLFKKAGSTKGGSGVRLMQINGLLQELGGSIAHEPTAIGTTFTVELPNQDS